MRFSIPEHAISVGDWDGMEQGAVVDVEGSGEEDDRQCFSDSEREESTSQWYLETLFVFRWFASLASTVLQLTIVAET